MKVEFEQFDQHPNIIRLANETEYKEYLASACKDHGGYGDPITPAPHPDEYPALLIDGGARYDGTHTNLHWVFLTNVVVEDY